MACGRGLDGPSGSDYRSVIDLPEPDWYLDNVLVNALPGRYEQVPRGAVADWQALWRERAAAAEAVLATAAQRGFVLSSAELTELRITRSAARHAVAKMRWTRAGYGYIAPLALAGETPALQRQRHAIATAAAVRSRPREVVSGRSAATLWGLPTLKVPTVPELTVRGSVGAAHRRTSHLYVATLHPVDVTTWYGVPVTTLARTLVDLGRHDRRDALMAADAALRAQLVTRHTIDCALANAAGWPGVRQAREILALASPLAESALESLARLVMYFDGLPMPELQVRIGEYRVDMLFREQRLIVEIDGLEKYTVAELRREKRREQRLRILGYRIERLTWDDLVLRWPQTRVWLRAALRLVT